MTYKVRIVTARSACYEPGSELLVVGIWRSYVWSYDRPPLRFRKGAIPTHVVQVLLYTRSARDR